MNIEITPAARQWIGQRGGEVLVEPLSGGG